MDWDPSLIPLVNIVHIVTSFFVIFINKMGGYGGFPHSNGVKKNMDEWCLRYVLFALSLALVDSECVSFIIFTTLEYEKGNTGEEAYFNSRSEERRVGKECRL